MADSDINANVPLTEATLLILLSLTPGPKHGYAIMKDVQSLSEGRVALSTGTLYGALKRLLAQGWIERCAEPDEGAVSTSETGERGRPRKAYALTRLGQRVLDVEVSRLQALVSVARLRTAGRQA